MPVKMTLPQLVVVSLHKSGTHLILRLIEEIGYERRYFDDALIKSAQRDPADVCLGRLEPNAAYFLHECRIDKFPRQFLDHWRGHGVPLFVYQYRDPRAVLLSHAGEVLGEHADAEGALACAGRYRTALEALLARAMQKRPEDRFDSADAFGEALAKLRRASSGGRGDQTGRGGIPPIWHIPVSVMACHGLS